MKDFMKILRDADMEDQGGPSSVAESVSNAFSHMDDKKPAEVEQEPAEVQENDPTKAQEENPEDNDPELEMDYEEEVGKGKAKLKTSELKEAMKFLFENRQDVAGAMKLREVIGKNPSFGKLYSTIINKAFEGETFNEDFVTKTLGTLEAKVEQTAQQVEKVDDHIADMEKDLQELDPDSPQYRVLSKNISHAKQLSAQLSQTQAQNKAMQEKLEKVVKFQDDSVQSAKQQDESKQVERLAGVFDAEIGALTDASKQDGFKFINDSVKGRFDKEVREAVAARSAAIKTDADFVKAIKDEAHRIYKQYVAESEAYVNDYLKKKGGLPPKAPEIKKEENKEPMTSFQMGDQLADAMLGVQK